MFCTLAAGGLLTNQLIPKTGGGFHPHLVDFYVPTGTLARAVVFLHGGGSTKEEFALQMRVSLAAVPVSNRVNWTLLDTWNCIAVFPQGQAMIGQVTATNPTGIDTRSANYPDGIACWGSRFMNSGADDVLFLQDLADYITTTYGGGVSRSLCGHSAGGFMAERMWFESPTTFGHYCSLSAVAAQDLTGATQPTVKRPILVQIGAVDPYLGNYAGSADHFQDNVWVQASSQINRADVHFPFADNHVGAWKMHLDRCAAVSETPTFGGATVTDLTLSGGVGTMKTWSNNGGAYELRLVSAAGHQVPEHNTALGTGVNMFNQFLAWILLH